MSLQWPAPDYVDGGLTSAAACSLPEFFPVLPSTTAEYAFRQDFMQLRANFAPTAMDTAHPSAGLTPDYSDYLLVREDVRRDVGGGLVRWTRTYAKKPADYDDFESFAYQFIGFAGNFQSVVVSGAGVGAGAGSVLVTGRPRRTQIVSSRIANAFFHVGGSGEPATPADITLIKAQRYLTTGASAGYDVDFITDAVGPIPATDPSRTDYDTLVTDETEIVAEDSRLERLFGSGNFWVRKTRYVVAI